MRPDPTRAPETKPQTSQPAPKKPAVDVDREHGRAYDSEAETDTLEPLPEYDLDEMPRGV